MSADAPADAPDETERRDRDADPTLVTDRFRRKPGIERGTVSHVDTIGHGVGAAFHLDDHHYPTPLETPKHSNIPDGSLYQRLRNRWLTADDDERVTYETSKGEYEAVVLNRSPDFATLPDSDEQTAIVLTSSRWVAGTGLDDAFSQWYEYIVARRPIDEDGDIQFTRTPKHTATARVQPQYDELVYEDGNDFTLPYGEGTRLKAKVNYCPTNTAVFARMNDLLREGLGYSLDYDDVRRYDGQDYESQDDTRHDGKADTDESRDLLRVEQYARVNGEYMDELQATLRQSLDLLPANGGRAETINSKTDKEGRWLRYGFISDEWERLGYPNAGNLDIGVKVYVDNHDAPEPYCHPKIEAWVARTDGAPLKWNSRDWDAVNAVLREIVVSHLHHAGISRADLEEDDEYKPTERDTVRALHPQNRREWLRNYYAELKSTVHHEAKRTRTDLSRDIMRSIIYEGRDLTLAELAERTGATKRAITKRVRKMENAGRDGEAGIVERVRSNETHVSMAREMRSHVRDVLNATHPGETWSDVEQRRDERRDERRAQRDTSDETEVSDTDERAQHADETDETETSDTADAQHDEPRHAHWRRLDRTPLNPQTLARAIDNDYLTESDVQVRTSASPALLRE